MSSPGKKYDAIVVGGGPAGSTAAIVLARAGFIVCVLEKDRHPRLHVGESILPRNMAMIRELGLEAELARLPQIPKLGAEFGFGNDPATMKFSFTDGGFLPGCPVFNIERALFDKMLLDQARIAGADVFEGAAVTRIVKLEEDDVELATVEQNISGRVLVDASGHGTVVGRHLGLRRNFDDPNLQKVAYFQHFDNVERLPGDQSGFPSIFMADEGWFWIIGLNESRTSVGFVTRPDFVKQIDVPPARLLQWAVSRCPVVRHRMRDAVGDATNHVVADFSYTCRPCAGPGYFLVGDAGAFLDPIFSTGVTLAMVGANQAAKSIVATFNGQLSRGLARRDYIRFVEGSTAVFWRLIRKYYRHSFRELFMQGQGPLQVHRAVISILAGSVFPRPMWSLRWRLRFFELCVFLQQYVTIVPRRARFSLMTAEPTQLRESESNSRTREPATA